MKKQPVVNNTDRMMLIDWVSYWKKNYGITLSLNTLRVRRRLSGIGQCIPPHTYLLTYDEMVKVLATPLPGCNEGARLAR